MNSIQICLGKVMLCLLEYVMGSYHQSQIHNNLSLDSDDDFRSGCWNVSHHYPQQSFSGLHSPGWSNYTITCYPRVQTIYCINQALWRGVDRKLICLPSSPCFCPSSFFPFHYELSNHDELQVNSFCLNTVHMCLLVESRTALPYYIYTYNMSVIGV